MLVDRDEFGLMTGQQRLGLVVVLLRLHEEKFDFYYKVCKRITSI